MANYKPIAKRNFSVAVPVKKAAKAAPTKPKPAPKPAPVKAAPPTPSVPTGPYQSLVDLYNQQKTDLGAYHQQQQQALQGFTDTFMKYLSGLAPKVGGDYDAAINQANNLAQTAATGLANLNPHGEASLLGGIGAPEAQQAQIAAQNQQAFGGGAATLYDVAGAIPGTNLASQKANQMAFLNTLPGIESMQGNQILQGLLSSQSKQYNDLLNSQTESLLKAQGGSTTAGGSLKAPTVRNFSDGTTRQYNPATNKWSVITTKAGGAPSSKAPTVKKIGSAYYQWSGKAWVKLADASPSDHFTTTTLSNGQKQTIINGQPVGKAWGPVKVKGAGSSARPRLYGNSSSGYFTYDNGSLQPVPGFTPGGKNGKGGKAPTPSQVSVTFNRATKAGHDALNQVTANIWAKTPGHESVKGTPGYEKALQSQRELATKAFGTAMYRVIVAIGPHLKAIGYNPSQVKQAAYQIVSSTISPPAGYKPPKVTANPKMASYTGGGGEQLIALLKQAGFKGDGLRIAYGIALRESGGRPDAFNGNTGTGDRSWGLFQINTLGNLINRVKQFGLPNEQALLDPLANAKAAYAMSNGGTDFGAWGIGPNAYRTGRGLDTIRPWGGMV